MITILGKLTDTAAYLNLPGYNVSAKSPDWTPETGRAWLHEAVKRGDSFLLVSTEFSGMYAKEIRWLQEEEHDLRNRAGVLVGRALELGEAIKDVSSRARWGRELEKPDLTRMEQ